ncbi:MAG: hypothetical protein KG012_17220 [Deltaproteobacteria bacterium]|nr:hypothetical protein [Deltaproteobacteria bacterium]
MTINTASLSSEKACPVRREVSRIIERRKREVRDQNIEARLLFLEVVGGLMKDFILPSLKKLSPS